MDAFVGELADGVIELDGDAVRGALYHGGRQTMDVGRPDVVADADTITDAEASQGIGETCGLDGLQAVADGVVEEGEVAVELARDDQSRTAQSRPAESASGSRSKATAPSQARYCRTREV